MKRAPLLLLPLLMGALPARYNEPVAAGPRAQLVTHIEELTRKVAAESRRAVPEIDARLEAAVALVAHRAPTSGPPPNELVEAALWLHGIVEPPPHLVVVTMSRGADERPLLDELRGQLPSVLSSGNYRRVGAAAEEIGDEVRVVLALQESSVELGPVPRALAAGGSAPLTGRVKPPFVRPEVLVTGPDGKVQSLFAGARDEVVKFAATLRCEKNGRHQVEIVANDRFGPSVLANFPVECGGPAPHELEAARLKSAPVEVVGDAGQAESRLAALLAADRKQSGVAPLALDARLSAVARAHSEEMVRHHFFGHVSPTTGSAADRLKAAKIQAQLVLENVARAYSPAEVERGLMDSPGHRANLLSTEVSAFGVGVALGEPHDGVRELFATQLFMRGPAPLPRDATSELKRRIGEFRQSRGLGPLGEDVALDRVAGETAGELAAGRLDRNRVDEPIARSLGEFAHRYRTVRSAMAITADLPEAVESLARSLSDKSAAGLGVGVGRRGEEVFVVILLGTGR